MDSLKRSFDHHSISDGISERILSQDETPNQASEEASPDESDNLDILTDPELEYIEEVSADLRRIRTDLLNGPVGDQGLPDFQTTFCGGHRQEQIFVLEGCKANEPTYQSINDAGGGIEDWLDKTQLQSADSPKETGEDIRSETLPAAPKDLNVDLDASDDDSQVPDYQISTFISSDEKTSKTTIDALGKQVADAVEVYPDPILKITDLNFPSHRFRYESERKPADGKRKRNLSRDTGYVEVLSTGQIDDLIIQLSIHQKDGKVHPNRFYVHDSSKNVIQVADNILQISTSNIPENIKHKTMLPAFSIQRAKVDNKTKIDTGEVMLRVNIYGNKGNILLVKDCDTKLECAKRHNKSISKLSPNGCSWDDEKEIDLLGDNSNLRSIRFENETAHGDEYFYQKITEYIHRDKNKVVFKAPRYYPSGGSVKVILEFGNKSPVELQPFIYTPRQEISNARMKLMNKIRQICEKDNCPSKRHRFEDYDDQ